jgi:tRNA/rRNA methyltransferase
MDRPADTMLSNARVVLVRPHYAGNVGAVARVMCNFGLRQVALVSPFADPRAEEARRLATHGEPILGSATVVQTLDDAVADCRLVLATSANVEGLYRTHNYGHPDEVLPEFVAALEDGPCALVFGPEPSGLTNSEVARCHRLIRILTDAACPSLNLSHAVAICLYELRRLWLNARGVAVRPTQKIAPFADQERMFQSLRGALEAVHFIWGTKADSLMHAVRHLIARAKPSPNEVRILFGLARQLRWAAEHGVSGPDPESLDESDG